MTTSQTKIKLGEIKRLIALNNTPTEAEPQLNKLINAKFYAFNVQFRALTHKIKIKKEKAYRDRKPIIKILQQKVLPIFHSKKGH
ncbi:hypothetical protein JP35_08475 [Gallibacterium anatis]|uniref:hypothetical protein n=1 Tax=Gallibacterium anatis TaxID=750 RepID=UPI000530FB92|nr:hypothetical protein [Gallibacterium anatis]KGQ38159.1 hypothetical protein JP35_08475 [Gallibacterium anatis]